MTEGSTPNGLKFVTRVASLGEKKEKVVRDYGTSSSLRQVYDSVGKALPERDSSRFDFFRVETRGFLFRRTRHGRPRKC